MNKQSFLKGLFRVQITLLLTQFAQIFSLRFTFFALLLILAHIFDPRK